MGRAAVTYLPTQDIKLIALDLDGTLLTTDKQLTARSRAALAAAANCGIQIVPATGRFYLGIPEEVRTLPGVRYAITINGACVYDAEEERSVYDAVMPLEVVFEVLEFLDRYPVIYDCYQNSAGWMPEWMWCDAEQYIEQPPVIEMVHRLRKPIPDLKAFLRERGEPVQKLQLFTKNRTLRFQLYSMLGRRFPDLAITMALPNNVEINAAAANKGAALEALLQHLGIPSAQSLSFGDGLNDLPLIRAAGTGVAMGNAYQEVKEAADLLTDDNDSDGVAKVIESALRL